MTDHLADCEPTMNLRFVEKYSDGRTTRILQQEWVDPQGAKAWVDIPMIRESELEDKE